MDGQETTACKYCGKPTPMLGTKLCDGCWELETRIKANPELARKIMKDLEQPLPLRRPATKIEVEAIATKILIPDPDTEFPNLGEVNLVPARRPGTKLESEMTGAICSLQDELRESREIIKDLLDVFPGHAFPERYTKAKRFLTKENQ
ncbi:MAG: hypothetical protein ACYTEQ_26800 [Planctomycetota bacterium]|jgi:hypothetical protein